MQKTGLRIIPFITLALSVFSGLSLKAQDLYPGHSFEGQVVFGTHAIGGAGGVLQDKLYGFDFSFKRDLSHLSDKWVGLTHAQSAGVGLVFRDLQYLKGHQDTSANSFGQAIGLVGQMDFRLFNKGATSVTF
ncbi:MAG TPA: hypothetical protein VLZ28_02030, partial [Daejeonella sp.]|nr:hypothetical protein [Daejeonella sp.]